MIFKLAFIVGSLGLLLHAPVESFSPDEVIKMDENVQLTFANIALVWSSESVEDTPGLEELTDEAASSARQAIYHMTTSDDRFEMLINMIRVYSKWSDSRGESIEFNPRVRCNEIRTMLTIGTDWMTPAEMEESILGWILFCSNNAYYTDAKFE
jgi:hypothetical protein